MSGPVSLREAVVFLAAADAIVPLMQRFRISPVFGWLAAGFLLGPHGAARLAGVVPPLCLVGIAEWGAVSPLAEIGVLFLMFSIGLELSFERLWALRRLVFGLGGAQVAVPGTVIGLVAWGFGNRSEAAIVLGACLAPRRRARGRHDLDVRALGARASVPAGGRSPQPGALHGGDAALRPGRCLGDG